MPSPADVVQAQLDAYNARDLERYLANFSDTVKSYRMPSLTPALDGKAQLGAFYAAERFNRPGLRAELLHRTVLGNQVFDHERIFGIGDAPYEIVAVFEVKDGLIETLWGYSA